MWGVLEFEDVSWLIKELFKLIFIDSWIIFITFLL